MKIILSILCFMILILFAFSTMATNKVVVIPLGSGAQGKDGQVQYNDNGKTAGAEVYYDNATGKLEANGEVRTIDVDGNTRLWGKGRPGTGLITHTDSDGYCTTTEGVNYALSKHLVSWESTDHACPAGTWVCRANELPTSGSCDIVPTTFTYTHILCTGVWVSPSQQAVLTGWVSDIDGDSGYNVIYGLGKHSDNLSFLHSNLYCKGMHVWCCWE